MKKMTHEVLAKLGQEAEHSPRHRMNHNLHTELSDPVQRLAIAMEPETYIRPHRHPQTWELLTSLKGRFVVLHFDETGMVTHRCVLGGDTSIIETEAGGWHAVLSLDPGGVIFEVKQGPYAPFKEEDSTPWSPAADAQNHLVLMDWYRKAEVGQRWSAIQGS